MAKLFTDIPAEPTTLEHGSLNFRKKAYTTKVKIYPVANLVSGVVDIYYNKPFQIPAFESVAVSPEVLDK